MPDLITRRDGRTFIDVAGHMGALNRQAQERFDALEARLLLTDEQRRARAAQEAEHDAHLQRLATDPVYALGAAQAALVAGFAELADRFRAGERAGRKDYHRA